MCIELMWANNTIRRKRWLLRISMPTPSSTIGQINKQKMLLIWSYSTLCTLHGKLDNMAMYAIFISVDFIVLLHKHCYLQYIAHYSSSYSSKLFPFSFPFPFPFCTQHDILSLLFSYAFATASSSLPLCSSFPTIEPTNLIWWIPIEK